MVVAQDTSKTTGNILDKITQELENRQKSVDSGMGNVALHYVVIAQEAKRRNTPVEDVIKDEAFLKSDSYKEAFENARIKAITGSNPEEAKAVMGQLLGEKDLGNIAPIGQPEGTKAPEQKSSAVSPK